MATVGDAVVEHGRAFQERSRDVVGHQHAAQRHVCRADALGEGDDVGADVVAGRSEPLAKPTEAADHLVGHQQHAVLVADRAHALVVALGRGEGAARVLHRLHEHGGHRIGALLLDHVAQLVQQELRELLLTLTRGTAVAVGVGDVADTGQERLERRLQRVDAGQRQRAQGGAVVGDAPRDHLVAVVVPLQLVVLAHELDDRLVGLRSARHEEGAVEVAGRELGHLGRQLDRARMRVAPVGVEGQLRHLRGGRLTQLGAEAVPDLGAEEAGQPVEVALSLAVVQVAALPAGDDRHVLVAERGVPREVHHQMPLGEFLQPVVRQRGLRAVAGHRGDPCLGDWTEWPIVSGAHARSAPSCLYSLAQRVDHTGAAKMAVHASGPKTEQLMAKRDAFVARGVALAPIVADHAHGARLTDVDGKEYIDFAGGIGVLNLGHTPERVVEAIKRQADAMLHSCFPVAAYEPYLEVSRLLCEHVPGTFAKKAVLVNSGAEAVENAVKIARYHTGRAGVITFDRGFHGRTLLTMTLTSKLVYKRGMGPFAPEVYRAPAPYPYRGITTKDALKGLEFTFKAHVDPESVACVILEPVQGEGGFTVMPPESIQGLYELCQKYGIVYIDDEVQSGMGRTGTLWGIEHSGVTPDLITVGKSLAAGMPLAGVVGRAEILDSVHPGGLGSTYGGNPVACAAAIESINAIASQDFLDHAKAFGEEIQTRLRDMA